MSSSGQWHPRNQTPPFLSAGGSTQIKRDQFYVALVREVAKRMTAIAGGLEEVLAEVVDFLPSVMRCDSCFIYVLEEGELVLRASKNPHAGVVNRVKLKADQEMTGGLAVHGQHAVPSFASTSDAGCRLFNRPSAGRFESFLSVPLLSRNKLVGLVNLQGREARTYTEQEIDVVTTIGYLVGGEIEVARLQGENLRLSQRLESRKLVERAKGILQRELNLGEPEAHAMLQRQSQQMRKPLKEIAEAIILSDSVKYGAH